MKLKESRVKDYIKHMLSNLSLRSKLIISFITVVAIPVIVISLVSINNIEKSIKDDAIKKHTYELEAEISKMENNISIMGNIAQTVVSNKYIMNFIDRGPNVTVNELYEFNRTSYKELSNLQNNNQSIKAINIFTREDSSSEFWPFIYRESRIRDNDWYDKTVDKGGQVYWNLYHYDDIKIEGNVNGQAKELIVSLNRELRNENGEHNGIVRVAMSGEEFLPIMFNISDNSYSEAFIYNKKTNEMYSSNKDETMSIESINKKDMFNQVEEKFVGDSGVFEDTLNNKPLIFLYRKTTLSNSYVVNVLSTDKLLKGVSNGRKTIILGAVFALLSLVIVIYILTNFILRRLYTVINCLKKVQQGDFMVEIPIYGNDEIGLLAHNFRIMIRKIEGLIKESINKEMVTKEAELKALKTQIDAHFLYNTLENIRMMAEMEENYTVSDSLGNLGDLMRYNTRWSSEFVIVKEEINHIKNYISLMTLRYDYDINLLVEVPEELMYMRILKLTVQPLVENAVKHGLAKKLRDKDGNIVISIEEEENFTVISVVDDGIGMDEKKVISLQKHITDEVSGTYGLGLKNVNERLKLFYGENYGVFVESRINEYTKLSLKIPK